DGGEEGVVKRVQAGAQRRRKGEVGESDGRGHRPLSLVQAAGPHSLAGPAAGPADAAQPGLLACAGLPRPRRMTLMLRSSGWLAATVLCLAIAGLSACQPQ